MNQFPYIEFGQLLERARKSKGFTQKAMAEKIGVTLEEYAAIEEGKKLPDKNKQFAIAKFLGLEFQEIAEWTKPCRSGTTSDKEQEKFVSSYEGKLDEMFELLKLMHGRWRWVVDDRAIKGFEQLKKDILNFSSFHFLPEGTSLLLEILLRQEANHKYLREYQGLFAEGENFAGFIARQPLEALTSSRAANALLFPDKPLESVEELCDGLTYIQFENIYYLSLKSKGIFGHKNTLPYLQLQSEFSSTAALMVRLIKKDAHKYLNYDHLYSSVLFQNIGEFVLTSIVYDDMAGPDGELHLKPEYAFLSNELMEHLRFDGHPVFGSIVLERFGLTKDVCDAVLKHHDLAVDDSNPLQDIDPLVMTMKLIARYTDNHFLYVSPDNTKELLKTYYEVKISPDEFYKACLKMYEMRNGLVEVSSTVLEQANPESIMYGQRALNSVSKKLRDEKEFVLADWTDKENIRHVAEYHLAFKKKAEELFSVLKDRMIMKNISRDFNIPKEDIYNKLNACKIAK